MFAIQLLGVTLAMLFLHADGRIGPFDLRQGMAQINVDNIVSVFRSVKLLSYALVRLFETWIAAIHDSDFFNRLKNA